ncbi:MAG: glycosyltransferase family 4 protein [Chloroflexi bacterium]|nr:glycosyltransferase family 4 protein [Chloroflexota bacterium]
MHILFLTQVLPYPLDAGPKVRAYYMLKYLAASHQVTLVSFVRDSDHPEAIAHLRELCVQVHTVPMQRARSAEIVALGRSLISSQPYTILRDARGEMCQQIDEVIAARPFDAIHSDQLSMAQYAQWAVQALIKRWPQAHPILVLDAHNAYYLIPQRMADISNNPALKLFLKREAHLIARYEADVYRRFDHVLTVTPEDLASIQKIGSFKGWRPRFTTVPICVDASVPRLPRQAGARGLLMLGGLHWPPNADAVRWFAHDIWPLVRAQVPDAQLFVVGARPPDDIRSLGDFQGIQQPERAGGAPVVVTGYVKDPLPFLKASAVLVVALRSGGGMRVKIVDALQWGLPVVSTSIGCEGICVTPGQDALIADDTSAFARALASVLQDPSLAEQLAGNGRQLLVRHYDWRRAYTVLEEIYTRNGNTSNQRW